jgi:hypothetical protein
MQAHWYAAPIVFYGDTPVAQLSHNDASGVSPERLIGGVIDHLLHNVQGTVGTGVHAWSLPHGLETLQNPDRGFGVRFALCRHLVIIA